MRADLPRVAPFPVYLVYLALPRGDHLAAGARELGARFPVFPRLSSWIPLAATYSGFFHVSKKKTKRRINVSKVWSATTSRSACSQNKVRDLWRSYTPL